MHDDHEASLRQNRSHKNHKTLEQQRFAVLRELVQAAPETEQLRGESAERLQAVRERLQVNMGQKSQQRISTGAPLFRRMARVALVAGASVVALLVALTFARTDVGMNRASRIQTYVTGPGERATITLPDGSLVVLAPETRLRARSGDSYNNEEKSRVLELEGEAFFTVVPDPDAPFTVISGDLQANVLGTSFLVRRYGQDSIGQVAVVTGKVAVSRRHDSQPVVVTPGTLVTVTDSSVIIHKGQDVNGMAAWTDGTLVFDETPVPVMLATIGRWYNVEFRLADSTLRTRHVSMVFHTNQRFEAMEKIRAVLGVTMSFDGRVVTLRPGQARLDTLHRRSPLAPAATGVGK